MNAQQTPFTIGLTYWPRRKAYRWWSAFDRAEVRDELAHVASIGINLVRFYIRWEDFQPATDRINSRAFRSLEQALDAAAAARLKVVPVLFPAGFAGAVQLPRWAGSVDPLDELWQTARFGPRMSFSSRGAGTASLASLGPALTYRAPAQAPILYEYGYHYSTPRNPFDDPVMRDAQSYFVSEIVGYFGSHPAIWGWQLGEGLERVMRPSSEAAVRDWYLQIAGLVREHHDSARVIGVTSERGLTMRSGPRPEHLAEACDMVGVAADPPLRLPGSEQAPLRALSFTHSLVTTLAEKPVIVAGLGVPTTSESHPDAVTDQVFGRQRTVTRLDAERQARFVVTAVEQLQRAGAAGAWLAAYADYAPELWRLPPLDRALRERSVGLVDQTGREKLVAIALRSLAARVRDSTATPQRHTLPEVDPERFWRDPERACRELWRSFESE